MSVQRTRDAVERYLNSAHTDLSMMADDVVFTTMATGDEHRGVEGVKRMLRHVYHEAFGRFRREVLEDEHLMLASLVVGRPALLHGHWRHIWLNRSWCVNGSCDPQPALRAGFRK